MFRGINEVTLDNKGRLAVPTRVRDALAGDKLVLTIDTEENCLLLYPEKNWQLIEEKLQQLPSFNASARRIQRLLLGHATDVEPDSNWRLLLPAALRAYAKLDKHAVLIGQGNKFELWDATVWEERRQQWLSEEAAQDGLLPEELKNLYL